MASPFPGMDPYLEHPDIFSDFHDSFIAYLRETLLTQLPEPYYAALGRRAWIELSQRYIGPDVDVVRAGGTRSKSTRAGAVSEQAITQPLVIHVPHDERVEPLIEIYLGPRSNRRLVSTIEVLSRANKTSGEHGRDLYLRKQQEILGSKVHLVEIDLLREGQHTTAVPEKWLRAKTTQFDYHVCVHRFDKLEDFFIYPIQLHQPLPVISVPLLPGDSAVSLDLQAVFHRTYEAGPYSREIDYQHDTPIPPLSDQQSEWAAQLLRTGS